MAILQVNFLSQTLKRTVPVQVVLPSDKVISYNEHIDRSKPYKTLYLLHGLLGNCTDWTMNTSIQSLAEDRNLAVVMPSGENSFYIDQLLPNNAFGEGIYWQGISRSNTPHVPTLSQARRDFHSRTFHGRLWLCPKWS